MFDDGGSSAEAMAEPLPGGVAFAFGGDGPRDLRLLRRGAAICAGLRGCLRKAIVVVSELGAFLARSQQARGKISN